MCDITLKALGNLFSRIQTHTVGILQGGALAEKIKSTVREL